MADKLIIHNLTAKCQIGLTEEERATPQTVWIDLELAIDAAKAAYRDRVQDAAVDYAEVVSAVQGIAQRTPYNLLETLADHVATFVLGKFRVPWVRVKVKKRALPGIDHAAVEIERMRRRGRVGRSLDSASRPRSGFRPAAARRGAA